MRIDWELVISVLIAAIIWHVITKLLSRTEVFYSDGMKAVQRTTYAWDWNKGNG